MTRKQRKTRKKQYKRHMREMEAHKILEEAERLSTFTLTGIDTRGRWRVTNNNFDMDTHKHVG